MSAIPKIESFKKDSLKELFQSLSFFKEFPESLIDHLREVTTLVKFDADEVVIEQGQFNSKLYFLILGTVDILVDGGRVATLSRKGDLLGEMSVITQKISSATVKATTPVEVFCVDSNKLQELTGANRDQVDHLLYRIYSMILTDKLTDTNQKAKGLEETSAQLEKAKSELIESNSQLEVKVAKRTADLRTKNDELLSRNVELIASHKKIEEMYNSRDMTFSMLDDLRKNKLLPLKDTLQRMYSQTEGEARDQLDEGISHVKSVLKMLEPLTERFSTEMAMKEKKVLIAESSRKHQVTAKMALGGTGIEFEIVDSIESGKEKIQNGDWDVLIADGELIPLAEDLRSKNPNADVVFITSGVIQSYMKTLKGLNFQPNIVSRDENDRNFTVKNIMTTATKLASHDVFGIDKYLAWGVDIIEKDVTKSDQRSDLIQEAEEYFTSMGIRKSILSNVNMVCEEILMNAIYDAPTDENGKSTYNHLDRTVKIELKPEEQSAFRYACDGNMVAVSVEDPFGGLTQKIVLNYLESCYGGEEGVYNKEKGGAGRGLHQIIENADLVVFNVAAGKRTEVIAFFSTMPNKDEMRSPAFHFFSV